MAWLHATYCKCIMKGLSIRFSEMYSQVLFYKFVAFFKGYIKIIYFVCDMLWNDRGLICVLFRFQKSEQLDLFVKVISMAAIIYSPLGESVLSFWKLTSLAHPLLLLTWTLDKHQIELKLPNKWWWLILFLFNSSDIFFVLI